MRKFLAVSLIFVGLSIILYNPLQELYSKYVEEKLIESYENSSLEISESEQQDIASFYTYFEDLQVETNNSILAEQEKPKEDTKDVIGIISIDKINLKLPVKSYFTEDEIKSSVGHLSGTALPGETGNCVIAGHRCYTKGKLFNRLDELSVDDIIYLSYNSKTFKYKVVSKLVVEPTDISVLNSEDNEIALTLITCHPYKVNTHRLIIKAILDN